MPLFSQSPHRPGSAEDLTFKLVEDAQERAAADPNAGAATMAVSVGLGHLLRSVFLFPVVAFRLLRKSGTVFRWTVGAAIIASVLGVMLSLAMHDEIMRAQVRLVPVGMVVGLALGLVRRSMLRKNLRIS